MSQKPQNYSVLYEGVTEPHIISGIVTDRHRTLLEGTGGVTKPIELFCIARECYRTHRTILYRTRVLQNLTDTSVIVTDRHVTIL